MATLNITSDIAKSGAEVRAALNAALQILASKWAAATEPAETYPFMSWMDTANNVWKIRNAGNDGWDIIGDIDATTGAVSIRADTGLPDISPAVSDYLLKVNAEGTALEFSTLTIPAAIPAGSVISLGFSTVPSGWLECDGSALDRTVYADLFAAIGETFGSGDGSTTFNIPDLRGEFIRGWDNGRGIDGGRSFGSAQADAYESHKHTGGSYVHTTVTNAYGNTSSTTGKNYLAASDNTAVSTELAYTSTVGSPETRPRNIALMYCIKY